MGADQPQDLSEVRALGCIQCQQAKHASCWKSNDEASLLVAAGADASEMVEQMQCACFDRRPHEHVMLLPEERRAWYDQFVPQWPTEPRHEPGRKLWDLDVVEDPNLPPNTLLIGTPDQIEGIRQGLGTKTRPDDQPLPLLNDMPIAHEEVIADLQDRLRIGIERYGTGLQALNNRDAGQDEYEELLDQIVYRRIQLDARNAGREQWVAAGKRALLKQWADNDSGAQTAAEHYAAWVVDALMKSGALRLDSLDGSG